MHVRHLSLRDFRSYPHVELELPTGVSVFLGSNGQGKTNLVEAIGYAATLGSHRVAQDGPLVRGGADQAFIAIDVVEHGRSTLVEVAIQPGKARRARLNRSPVPRATSIIGVTRVVMFAPEDLALVKGDPAQRRMFLDDLLVQRRPRLAATRADYERVVRQRNALLKSLATARRAPAEEVNRTLGVWDDQLATIGADLVAARVGLLAELTDPAVTAYRTLAGDGAEDLCLAYVSSVAGWLDSGSSDGAPAEAPIPADLPTSPEPWRQALLAAVAAKRKDECDRGLTLVGPHRDDLAMSLGAHPAKGFASHGESWSIALALRLASFDLLRRDQDDPILILDDVFAELDARRREHLVRAVADAEQVLVTAAVAADVPAGLRGHAYQVSAGAVVSQDGPLTGMAADS